MPDKRRTPEEIETINNISGEFSRILKEWIGIIHISKVNTLNSRKDYEGCCASHDYCDANMAMDEAFENITGQEYDADDGHQTSMINEAWDLAKLNDFYCYDE